MKISTKRKSEKKKTCVCTHNTFTYIEIQTHKNAYHLINTPPLSVIYAFINIDNCP